MDLQNLYKYGWRATLAAAGLVTADGKPRFRFHDLRHTAASHLIRAFGGQEVKAKVISDLLGHAKVAFTLDTYGHPF